MSFSFICRKNILHSLILLFTGLFFSGCIASPPVRVQEPVFTAPAESAAPEKTARPEDYWPSSVCLDCHDRIFRQHSESMHAKSFENPVFQAQYFNEVLPRSMKTEGLSEEARGCIACHAPVAYMKTKGYIFSRRQVDSAMSGVTCDFCHTIRGYKGPRPGNANYISVPGTQKLGPFKSETNWHHAYSELQTKSEFCAICHERVNRNGLEIMSTFTEWRNSIYAAKGIQCQDCHMNVRGFLTAGKPVYESGKAARMRLGYAPYRKRLYTHRFPGAHSRTQVEGALTLDMGTEVQAARPGSEITVTVYVDNSKTGHRMPSGSAELRLLYLDIYAGYGDRRIPLPAVTKTTSMYDVSGKGRFDGSILGDGFPPGRRIYRAVCIDKNGRQTLSSYDAVSIAFDNRLNAAEVRKETYRFRIPGDAKGILSLSARLYYLSYPAPFAARLGLPAAEPVEIASVTKDIAIDE
ncbi:MAG: hypothetical protein GXP46_03450 [Deferribacteres bacterium]|nr:hypothetical protein [Deferribacteres bacterium]